jgi:uncharacterized RDD family membrane protein YckC
LPALAELSKRSSVDVERILRHHRHMTVERAGWYPDPDADTDPDPRPVQTERYWDGHAWSHQVRTATGAVETGPRPAQPYRAPRPEPITVDGQRFASWWIRFGATALDAVVLVPVLAVASLPSVVTHWHSISTWWNDGLTGRDGGVGLKSSSGNPPVFDATTRPGLTLVLTLFVVALLYALVFLRGRQATPGKLLLGLQVRMSDRPGPLPWRTVVLRVALTSPLIIAVLLPYVGTWLIVVAAVDCLWAAWDPKKQTLHDKIAGTSVVLVER